MEINLKTLNPKQREAVTHDGGPILIVAGAGTGKTTVITQRIGWLIEQKKAKGDEILALTFTDKAAGEMEERVDRLLPLGYVDLWILTFHAFAEKILKKHALEIGLPNDFKLLNQTQQWLLVRQNLARFDLDYYRPLGNPTKFIHALIKLFSRAKDEIISPADYLAYVQELKLNSDNADFLKDILDHDVLKSLSKKEKKELASQEIKKAQEAAEAYHTYQQLLLENNALDFGDLINYCLRLFLERPAILAKYRQQFKYILVDEFQDTNYAQYELVKLLAFPQNNITVVGDDDQSIYKFRGASVSNILEFKQDYPKAKEIFLNDNYRSTQNILDLSYQFIQQNNPDRLEVKLAAKASGKTKKLTKKLIASCKDRGLISHFHFENIDDEVRGVLKQIVDLKEKDKSLSWNDFAILSRTNEVANYFVGAISQTKIPYQFLASRGLYNKPVVLDILAYLKLLDDYHESSAMYRVLHLSPFGLAVKTVADLNYWAGRKGYSLYQATQYLATWQNVDREIQQQLKKIIDLVTKHTQLAAQSSVSEVVMAFLNESGYLQYLSQQDDVTAQQNLAYLNQFYKKITDFESGSNNHAVKNFLDLIELELEAGEAGALLNNLDEGPESVKIMTVHAAKGLEFQYVFLVNLVDRRFPIDDRKDQIELPEKLIKEILPQGDAHLQEERRLFYVAMTRAKKGLFFTSAADVGGARRKKLSRFLLELKELGLGITDEEKIKKGKSLLEDQVQVIGRQISHHDLEGILPDRFSFTQLRAFETCPYQYRFAHVLRVPVRGKAQFSFGKTIHATLQQFFDLVKQREGVVQTDLFGNRIENKKGQPQKPKATLDELLTIYEKAWIDDWYTSRREQDEFKQKGKKALTEFYKKYTQELPAPKFLEQPFNLRLKDSNHEYTVRGVIDRIDSFDGGIEIIDYKTGEGKTAESFTAEDKEQLLIYQLAGQQVFDQKVKKLSFYYVEPGTVISFLGTEKELKKIEEKMINTIQAIRQGQFPPRPSKLCQWCDFKNICEYRTL